MREPSSFLFLLHKNSCIKLYCVLIFNRQIYQNEKKKKINLFSVNVPFKIMRKHSHCVKSVRIRSYSGPYFPAFGLNAERSPYSVQMQEKTDQNNSEYGHFSRSIWFYVVFRRHTMEHSLNISYGEKIRKKCEELLSFLS